MAAAGHKRKAQLDTLDEQNQGFLRDFDLYLHPAALSATRRTFFEGAIARNEGSLLKSAAEAKAESKRVIVLIENVLVAKDKLLAVVDKVAEEFAFLGSRVDVIGLSWLSKHIFWR
jgi:hypothetical protein